MIWPESAYLAAPPISWHDDFLGVAYRYYDLRMNVVPLFTDMKAATDLWHDVVSRWIDPRIRLRFVDTGDKYWFIMASESKKPESNMSFYKVLAKSENYERFKKGHDGEAYLRLGVYSKKHFDDVKDDAICNCGHEKEDHEEATTHYCLYEDCSCTWFESFQVNLVKKKKTVTDIVFMDEESVRDDSLAWNCFNANKYGRP